LKFALAFVVGMATALVFSKKIKGQYYLLAEKFM
jgi:hypothetical protein